MENLKRWITLHLPALCALMLLPIQAYAEMTDAFRESVDKQRFIGQIVWVLIVIGLLLWLVWYAKGDRETRQLRQAHHERDVNSKEPS